jgi:hypothetical protein
LKKSRDSSVGIAPGYGLDDRGSRFRFPAGARNFSLHHRIQNGSGAHPASCPMGIKALSLGVKQPGREADNSPPCSAEVKNAWIYTPLPQYVFIAWCSVKHRDNFTFIEMFSIWRYLIKHEHIYLSVFRSHSSVVNFVRLCLQKMNLGTLFAHIKSQIMHYAPKNGVHLPLLLCLRKILARTHSPIHTPRRSFREINSDPHWSQTTERFMFSSSVIVWNFCRSVECSTFYTRFW